MVAKPLKSSLLCGSRSEVRVQVMVWDSMRFKLYTEPGILALVGHGKDFRFYNRIIGVRRELQREK